MASQNALLQQIVDRGMQSRDPRTLFDNDFSTGLQGWSGLRTTGKNYYPSLSPASSNGPYAMILDCGDDGSAPSTPVDACKRSYAFEGLLRWRSRFTWCSTNDSGVGPADLNRLRWIIDWQRGQDRRWWEVSYLHYDNVSAVQAQWRVSNGNSATVTVIPELTGYLLGMNMLDKFDYHDIEIQIYLSAGRMQWQSIKVDTLDPVDLRGYSTVGVTTPEVDFENGSNFIFEIVDRTSPTSADPYMLVDNTSAVLL